MSDRPATDSPLSGEIGPKHEHAFLWRDGRYVCPCGVWCYDLPPITSPAEGDDRG